MAFPFSHVVVSFVFACCLGLLYLILGSRTVVSASRSHRLRCLSYRSIQFAVIAVHLMLWEEQQQVFASFPRGWASCLCSVWPAVHCVCIEGSRLSAVIGLCRSLWRPLPAAAEGADSSANKSVCLRRGGHPAERAGSGVWVGTPGPVGLSSPRWAPPDTAVGRVSSPRGVAQCLVPRKHP